MGSATTAWLLVARRATRLLTSAHQLETMVYLAPPVGYPGGERTRRAPLMKGEAMLQGRRGWAMFAFVVAAGGALAASPAGAVSGGVSVGVGVGVGVGGPAQRCAHLNGSVTISPGLTNTPTNNTASVNGSLSGCARTLKTGGSGTFTSTINLPEASCAQLSAGGLTLNATVTTTWRSGRVSNYALTIKTGKNKSVLVATIGGKVSSGLFSGKHVSAQVKLSVAGSPNCTTSPVTTLTFRETKRFEIA